MSCGVLEVFREVHDRLQWLKQHFAALVPGCKIFAFHVNLNGMPALLEVWGLPRNLEKIAMGRLSTESFDEFLSSLKRLGIVISNELELRERLSEARRWRYAFATLASNGRSLGIRFVNQSSGDNMAAVRGTLARYDFPEPVQARLSAAINAQH